MLHDVTMEYLWKIKYFLHVFCAHVYVYDARYKKEQRHVYDIYLKLVNLSGAEIVVFRDKSWNAMVADAQAAYITSNNKQDGFLPCPSRGKA